MSSVRKSASWLNAEEKPMTNSCCSGPRRETASPALEILKERFVRGEIDKTEFEEKRRIISDLPEGAQTSRSGCGCGKANFS